MTPSGKMNAVTGETLRVGSRVELHLLSDYPNNLHKAPDPNDLNYQTAVTIERKIQEMQASLFWEIFTWILYVFAPF